MIRQDGTREARALSKALGLSVLDASESSVNFSSDAFSLLTVVRSHFLL
jgi:hypothetical protein